MTQLDIVPYAPAYFAGVKALWEDAFPNDPPWNRAEVSIPAKMAVQPELFLIALASGEVIGSAMAGYDGHRGWLYSVAVLSTRRREGVGAALVRAAEERLQALGCAKINLQIRDGNEGVAGFYERFGYAVEKRINMSKRVRRS
jgi:ribosomal protein S18 acetylase RimI-like enzyme